MQHVIRAIAARKKVIFAVLATGLVLGVGGTMTLASWTDSEWAYGGNGLGGPGVGTSTFAIDQDANAYTGVFTNHDTEPGNVLNFGTTALSLTPGDTVYAQVAIATTAATTVAGTVVLSPAVKEAASNDTGDLLGSALHLSIAVESKAVGAAFDACSSTGFASYTHVLVNDATGIYATPSSTPADTVAAAQADTLHYCFKITLPAGASTTLQGRTVMPSWKFTGTSN